MTDRQLRIETEQKLQKIMENLRIEAKAGRTTIRLDHKDLGFSVASPAASPARKWRSVRST